MESISDEEYKKLLKLLSELEDHQEILEGEDSDLLEWISDNDKENEEENICECDHYKVIMDLN